MKANFQTIVEETLTTRLGHGQQNVISIIGDGNIVIQDVATSQIVVTQNINGIDEATFMREIVAKITGSFPLAPSNVPKELNTILIANPKKVIGRTYEVQHIMERLNRDNSLLLVSGIGGIGKTVTANYYYTLFHDLYQHILWLRGGQDLEAALLYDASLHESLGLSERLRPLMPFEKEENRAYALAVLEKALKNLPPRTLVLIDNAEGSDFRVIQKWQSTFKQFHFLITSRAQNSNLNTYELGVLPYDDALALFYIHYRFEQEDALAALVLEQLHYHTLIIELVAKAGQEGAIPLQDLLVFLQTGYIQHEGLQYKIDLNEVLPDRIPEEERIINYIRLFFNTILKLDEDEQQLLLSLSALPHTPHDKDLLLKILEGTPKKKAQTPLTPNELTDVLNALFRKGYLQRDDHDRQRFYALHTLIGTATKEHIPPTVERLERVIQNVGVLLHIDDTKDNPVDKFTFVPYGEAVVDLFPDSTHDVICYLQTTLGLVLIPFGNYIKAKDFLENVVHCLEAKYGSDDLITARGYSNLALALKSLGDYVPAKLFIEKAIKLEESNFEENHLSIAVSYSILAVVLKYLGDYSRAKILLEKVIRLNETYLGEAHPTTAINYSNLALVLQELGDYTGAKKFLEKAVHITEKYFGEDHPTTAINYSNLALVLKELGDYTGAMTFMKNAVRSAENNFGKSHPTTAINYSNLALIFQDIGNFKEAKRLFEKAIDVDEKILGDNHPETANKYSNLAATLLSLGHYTEAKELLQKAISSNEFNFGSDHPKTARSYSYLAAVLQALGNFVEAKELLEKTILSDEANFGSEHPNTAISYSHLALLLKDQRDYEQALLLGTKAYRVHTGEMWRTHPNAPVIEDVVNCIANEMLQSGWTEEQIMALLQQSQ